MVKEGSQEREGSTRGNGDMDTVTQVSIAAHIKRLMLTQAVTKTPSMASVSSIE